MWTLPVAKFLGTEGLGGTGRGWIPGFRRERRTYAADANSEGERSAASRRGFKWQSGDLSGAGKRREAPYRLRPPLLVPADIELPLIRAYSSWVGLICARLGSEPHGLYVADFTTYTNVENIVVVA